MKNIKEITVEDVQDLFDNVIFLRGEEYFEKGCVKSVESVDSLTLTGIVQGNEEYTVSISIDGDGEIICDCSCPCDFNCKHAAALLLKWLSFKSKHSKELKSGTASPKQSLKQCLNSKSKEELIELLEASIERYPELKSLIQMEREELINKIRKLFSEYWDWNEVKDLILQLEIILDGIRRNKTTWNKELYQEMENCSTIMIKNVDNVHDEGDLGIFLEDWFLTFGEVFSKTKPTTEQKKVFIQKIMNWIKHDDYGYDSGYEQALVGMCTNAEDISLIQGVLSDLYEEEEDRKEFLLKIYDRLGMQEQYLKTATETGNTLAIIEKLISLDKLEEALEACKKNKDADYNWSIIENRKIEILKKLGKKDEVKKALIGLIKRTGEFSYVPRLKGECNTTEWKNYPPELIADAQSKNRASFLSRLYYQESDFKKAYEYSKSLGDTAYLELLAKKLTTEYPELACTVFRKLCFHYINAGAGWPYQKAGKMLEAIKKINKKGDYFRKVKADVIAEHKKKYSLMAVIEKV